MRVTGIGVALIGLTISAYCGVMYMVYTAGAGSDPGEAARAARTASNLILPMMVSGLAITIGVGMAIFGEKGFTFSKSLAHRN